MEKPVFDSIEARTTFPAQITCSVRSEGARTLRTYTVCWQPEDALSCEAPQLTLRWTHALTGIQYQWHSEGGFSRSLNADWAAPVVSRMARGCPLHCFYDDAAVNRYTVALSDCVTRIERSFGVHEEDATLLLRVSIPLDTAGAQPGYTVTLWTDEARCRYEDAIRAVSAWWETLYPPMPVPDACREPVYSFWYSYHQELSAGEVEAECARAAQLGMKTVIVDDGWQTDDHARGYASCGDWVPCPGKFPDMRAHVGHVHALGLRYMLWFSVPFLGVHAAAAARFRDRTLAFLPENQTYVLDPRYPEVREYLVSTYAHALRDWQLDGLKLDFIDAFLPGPQAAACAPGMDEPVLDKAVQRLMIGVRDALCAIRPDVLIEFRQRYTGPAIRGFGNMLRVADCPNSALANRVGMVDLRLAGGSTAVHSDMLVWNPEETVENAVIQIENVLFCTVQISVRLDSLPPAHLRALRFWIGFMTREQSLLQCAPIRVESPQTLYPVVSTQSGGRSVIACYERSHAVCIPESLREVYVIHADSDDSLLLEFEHAARWTLDILSCAGEAISRLQGSMEGVRRIPTPPGGLIHLTRQDEQRR